jgi:hypothetical protein
MAFVILLGSVVLSAFCSDHFELDKTNAIFHVIVSCVDQLLCDFVFDIMTLSSAWLCRVISVVVMQYVIMCSVVHRGKALCFSNY